MPLLSTGICTGRLAVRRKLALVAYTEVDRCSDGFSLFYSYHPAFLVLYSTATPYVLPGIYHHALGQTGRFRRIKYADKIIVDFKPLCPVLARSRRLINNDFFLPAH